MYNIIMKAKRVHCTCICHLNKQVTDKFKLLKTPRKFLINPCMWLTNFPLLFLIQMYFDNQGVLLLPSTIL